MKDQFPARWAESPSTLRREPTPSELAGGFACGPLDIKLENELAFRLSQVIAEMVGTIEAAGITPGASLDQHLRAVRSGVLQASPDSGTNNALTIAPAPAHTSYVNGQFHRIRKAALNSTAGQTLAVNGLAAKAVLWPDGTATASGELAANSWLDVVYDSDRDRFIRLSTLSPTQIKALTSADTYITLNERNFVGGNVAFYSTVGTSTFVVPSGISRIRAKVWAGGGGGGSSSTNGSGAGGNGGSYREGVFTVTPGQTLTVIVGGGGAGYVNTTGQAGGTGGTSSVGSLISATGGSGGGGSNSVGAGGGLYGVTGPAAGAGFGGSVSIPGGQGANAYGPTPLMGSGGGGAFCTSGNGPSVSGGINATFPGGAGGGGAGGSGGAPGAQGLVIIEY